MQIQDFKSFLQACHNVCIIKMKKVPKSKLDSALKTGLEATIVGQNDLKEEVRITQIKIDNFV